MNEPLLYAMEEEGYEPSRKDVLDELRRLTEDKMSLKAELAEIDKLKSTHNGDCTNV